MECDNRFYLYTGHKFLCTISSTSVTIKKSPLSNFRIVSEQGRTKDLKTQNWQLYKSPERASAVSTNISGDQPSRRSGLGFIVFGSEAWVPVTSLGACDQSVCLEEYQLPVELDTKICLSFISCSSSVQHWESLGLFGLIVHGPAFLPIYNIPDILSMWSSADLCNVAWFATVEAKTATRVFLHQVGALQVHRLGGWRHGGGRRLGEGGGGGRGGGGSGSDDR